MVLSSTFFKLIMSNSMRIAAAADGCCLPPTASKIPLRSGMVLTSTVLQPYVWELNLQGLGNRQKLFPPIPLTTQIERNDAQTHRLWSR